MSLISTLAHAYAVTIADLKKAASFVETKALPALVAIKADAPQIEALTSLVSPQLANIERVGESLLGSVIQALEAGGAAVEAGGVNITLDAALVADIRAISPAIKAAAVANIQAATTAPTVKAA